MKILIDIDEALYKYILDGTPNEVNHAMKNGLVLNKTTNGDVLKMLFPPSVYYGDDVKHMMVLTKNCELTCFNNEWWDAPYKVESESEK